MNYCIRAKPRAGNDLEKSAHDSYIQGAWCSALHFLSTTCYSYRVGYPPWSSRHCPCGIWGALRVTGADSCSVLLYSHINQTTLFCPRFQLLMAKDIEGKSMHRENHPESNSLAHQAVMLTESRYIICVWMIISEYHVLLLSMCLLTCFLYPLDGCMVDTQEGHSFCRHSWWLWTHTRTMSLTASSESTAWSLGKAGLYLDTSSFFVPGPQRHTHLFAAYEVIKHISD